MEMKLYKCDTCGNIITKLMDSEVVPNCCNSPMTELIPESTDGALETHIPVYKKNRNVICISIGEEDHPMTEMHHIEFVILETNKGFYLHYLYNNCGTNCFPRSCFCLNAGEEPVSVIAYCNIHGLYLNKYNDLLA